MKIDKKIETPIGTVVFQGELTEQELDHVIELGLLVLMSRGGIDVKFQDEVEDEIPEPTDGSVH